MVELMWLTKCGEALANLGDLEMPCGSSSSTCIARSSASVSPSLPVLRKCTTPVKCHGTKNREETIFLGWYLKKNSVPHQQTNGGRHGMTKELAGDNFVTQNSRFASSWPKHKFEAT
jgi:hypothetical protein